MATTKRKPGGKKETGNELLENPEALSERLSRTEELFEKNKNLVFGIGGAIALLIVVIFYWQFNKQQRNQSAQEEMFQAVYYFEEGNFDQALNGDGIAMGFMDIIDRYGNTEAGNLARYYAGIIHMRQRNFQRAVDLLDDFSTSDYLVAPRGMALLGDAYMELGNYTKAASEYERAARTNANRWMSPGYWMKAALAYENAGNNPKAIDAYTRIIEDYPGAAEVQDAKKFRSRLRALAAR